MKGLVFTALLGFLEKEHGLEFADRILGEIDSDSGGAYTTVGSYPSSEMIAIVTAASRLSGRPVPDILRRFGESLFSQLVAAYPDLVGAPEDAFDLLTDLDGIIHVEVLKLYPDAELPTFETTRLDDRTLEVTYRSSRPFADLADGLIRGCCLHFGEAFEMTREPVSGDGSHATRFLVSRTGPGI
jgi:hypothetical protein